MLDTRGLNRDCPIVATFGGVVCRVQCSPRVHSSQRPLAGRCSAQAPVRPRASRRRDSPTPIASRSSRRASATSIACSREYAEREHIPGAVWGIIIDGKLAHVGVTGYRDVASKSPVDSGTVFRIASMTKSFTALSILKLRDEGKLSLDDLAEKWVPELAGLTYPDDRFAAPDDSACSCRTRRASPRTIRGATSSSP